MSLSDIVSRVSLLVGVTAFAVTGALSLRAQVEPLHAVLRGIAAFVAVVWLARWSGGALESLGPQGGGSAQAPRDGKRARSGRRSPGPPKQDRQVESGRGPQAAGGESDGSRSG